LTVGCAGGLVVGVVGFGCGDVAGGAVAGGAVMGAGAAVVGIVSPRSAASGLTVVGVVELGVVVLAAADVVEVVRLPCFAPAARVVVEVGAATVVVVSLPAPTFDPPDPPQAASPQTATATSSVVRMPSPTSRALQGFRAVPKILGSVVWPPSNLLWTSGVLTMC
jgi:hypothetical protein